MILNRGKITEAELNAFFAVGYSAQQALEVEKANHLNAKLQRWLAEIEILTGIDSVILAAYYFGSAFDYFGSSATLTKASPG